MRHIRTAILILILLQQTLVSAQVTIGSTQKTSEGALLQLTNKSVDADNSNATSGLGLPRVFLEQRNFLFPMFEKDAENSNKYKDHDNETENKNHIGLMVYNTNECLNFFRGYKKGIYVWDGSQWESLENTTKKDQKVKTFKDHEGNEYHYASFGRAGEWMVENLRTKTYSDGTTMELIAQDRIGLAEKNARKRIYTYPNEFGEFKSDVEIIRHPEIGLLYNWSAASNNENVADHINLPLTYSQASTANPDLALNKNKKYEVELLQPEHHVQGICPDGWHLPSTHDWNMLEREIYDNAHKYSRYTEGVDVFNGKTWNEIDPELERLGYQGWRGSVKAGVSPNDNGTWDEAHFEYGSSIGHGAAMKTKCLPSGRLLEEGAYASLAPIVGGFGVVLTGKVSDAEGTGNAISKGYGMNAYFWTSSINRIELSENRAQVPYIRYFGRNSTAIAISTNSPHNQFNSVRCKKTEPFNETEWINAWQ